MADVTKVRQIPLSNDNVNNSVAYTLSLTLRLRHEYDSFVVPRFEFRRSALRCCEFMCFEFLCFEFLCAAFRCY